MKVSIEVNGSELGVLNSKCFILEKMFDIRTVNSGSIKVDYPDEAGKYLLFSRVLNNKVVFINDSDPTKGSARSLSPYILDNGAITWWFWAGASIMLYVYREIKQDDEAKSYGLSIYNQNGTLFYSSEKLPLRIKSIREFTTEQITKNPQPSKDESVPYYIDKDCMVLDVMMYEPGTPIIQQVRRPIISQEGIVRLATAVFPSAYYGGSEEVMLSNYIVVAYAPDLLPRYE